MRRVWRLCRSAFRDRAFDGEGARRFGGRWNLPGLPAVYTSGSLALAALEILVHVDIDLAPEDFVAIPVDIPDDLPVAFIDPAALAPGWQAEYPPLRQQAQGGQWLRERTGAVLRVPSAVVPEEHNFLLNPIHADFPRLRIGEPRPFHFDRRLWAPRNAP